MKQILQIHFESVHYSDIIMSAVASQITNISIVCHSFKRRSKKAQKLCVTGLCEGNPPVTDGFSSQRASNAENISIPWLHHGDTHVNTSDNKSALVLVQVMARHRSWTKPLLEPIMDLNRDAIWRHCGPQCVKILCMPIWKDICVSLSQNNSVFVHGICYDLLEELCHFLQRNYISRLLRKIYVYL